MAVLNDTCIAWENIVCVHRSDGDFASVSYKFFLFFKNRHFFVVENMQLGSNCLV